MAIFTRAGRRRRAQVESFSPAWRKQGDGQVIVTGARTLEPDSAQAAADAFKKLIERLDGLDDNLHIQALASSNLAGRIERLPEMLATIPEISESQRKMVDALLESMRTESDNQRNLAEAIEKIPAQTARQTEELAAMREKLVAAADADMSMRRHLDKFIAVLDRMDSSTMDQSECIRQMQKTFAASDRYLKYLIVKQNKRMMWAFAFAMGVCVFAIGALVAVVAYVVSH